jgi:hypothetical protein
VEVQFPGLSFDLERDRFVVWVRWVSREAPLSPEVPPQQGVRVELRLNQNPVLGPTILWRRDLDKTPVYLASNRRRTQQILSRADGQHLDLQLVIHGSVAHAPYAALYHLRDYRGAAIDTAPIQATPLLQVQPVVPPDRWQVGGQANLRVALRCLGKSDALLIVD